MTPIIELIGLSVAYGHGATRRPVLRGIDLRVDAGELVAILGPNGSGKTTLLRAIAGTIPLAGGAVTLFGRDIARWTRTEVARRVAVLPQSMILPEGFLVRELVEMGRAPHATRWFGASRDDETAVEAALVDAGAVELADRPAEELSGGERQRVLVAMALAQGPDLLLLDEPTLHLDIRHQATLLATVDRLRARRGTTVIAVLHDLNMAVSHAPRAVVLDDGRVVADGEAPSVLHPALARDVFGVVLDEAWTQDGRRFLVPHRGELARNEPSVSMARITG